MLEKASKIVLNISGNVNPTARRIMRSAVDFKVRILLILLAQVITKHLRLSAFVHLESLTEML